MSVPDAAVEAAADQLFQVDELASNCDREFFRAEARAAIEAAMPAIREALAQEIEARHPFTSGQAARIVRHGGTP